MSGYGLDGHIGICFQQSGGTSYTSSMDYAPIISETITEEIEAITAEGMRGRFEEGEHYEGMHTVGGDVVMEVHPLVAGKFLRAFFGQSSGTAANSSFSHSFKGVTEDWDSKYAVPPMTVEVYRDTGSSFLYYDMLCSQLVFEWAAGALVKMTASLVGGNFAWNANSTPAYLAGSYFPYDTTSVSFGGSAIDYATALTLTLNQNLEAKHTLNGTKYANRIKRAGARTCELAGTFLFEDSAQALQFRAQTGQAVVLTNKGETTAQSYNNLLKFDMPTFIYKTFPVNIGGTGLIEVGWSGGVKYDSGSATLMEATLVNTVAAYA